MTDDEKEEFRELKQQIEFLKVRVGQLEDIPLVAPYIAPAPIVDVPPVWIPPEGPTSTDSPIGTSEPREYRVGDIPNDASVEWRLQDLGWG